MENTQDSQTTADTTTLKSCALTQRKWRHKAQQLLHERVLVNEWNYKALLPRYHGVPPLDDDLAVDLSEFPRQLILEGSSTELARDDAWVYADEVGGVARRCGARITSLTVNKCALQEIRDFLKLLALFPNLEKLAISKCDWARGALELPDPPPAFLRHLEVHCHKSMWPLAQWLSQIPAPQIASISWSGGVRDERAVASLSKLFCAVGPALTSLTLKLSYPQGMLEGMSALDQRRRQPHSDLCFASRDRATPTQLPRPLGEHRPAAPFGLVLDTWLGPGFPPGLGAHHRLALFDLYWHSAGVLAVSGCWRQPRTQIYAR